MKVQRMQAGFTLIELLVVIIILGILAATALPRFADLQVQARQAKLQAAYGAARAAAGLWHGGCIAINAGACPNAATTYTMEGTIVNGINQYPTADSNQRVPAGGIGIVEAAGLRAGIAAASNVDYIIASGAVGGGWGAAAGNSIIIRVASPTAGTCEFTYVAAAVAGGAPTFTMTAATSACT